MRRPAKTKPETPAWPSPAEPSRSVPARAGGPSIALILTVLLAVGLAAWDFWSQAGPSRAQALVYAPFTDAQSVALANPKPVLDPQYELGSMLYVKACAPCHQISGQGTPGVYPPLAGSDWVRAPGPERIIRLVLHGMQGPVTVNGSEYNNIMIPWRETLKDEEIAAVLTFIRGCAEWGNTAPPVSPAKVAEIRKMESSRDLPWSADELQKIPLENP